MLGFQPYEFVVSFLSEVVFEMNPEEKISFLLGLTVLLLAFIQVLQRGQEV